MAWEWVGPVATASVGLAGIGATLWTQKRGRQNTLDVAAQGRVQDRKRAAYERLLTQAIHVTEFVGGADVIWKRDAQPPDVDYESFDAWLALDLYASQEFLTQYTVWQGAVERLRDILSDLPQNVRWHEADDSIQDKFVAGQVEMEDRLDELKQIARRELSQG